jgi:hypothetical protein
VAVPDRLDRVTVDDLDALAIGAGILGTGGGGNPRVGRLRLQSILEDADAPDAVEVIQPEDLDDDATVTSVGGMGAPTIGVEKFPRGTEETASLAAIERASGREVDALIPGEIGGVNSIVPLCVGATTGLPVVDADGMGRAFPELQMDTFFVYGAPVNYAAITDERGNQAVYRDVDSAERLERFARAITVDMGGRAGYAFPLMDGAFVAAYAVPHTLSLAARLGHAVLAARSRGTDPVAAACDVVGGRELFAGKVTDVYRRNRKGFALGEVTLAALDGDDGLVVEFQNEFLVARRYEGGCDRAAGRYGVATDDGAPAGGVGDPGDGDDPRPDRDDDGGEVLATVPDLVCLVDEDTAEPVTTDALRYGQRVRVLGVPAPELLTTDAALEVIGPGAFGYDLDYLPLGDDGGAEAADD